LDDLLGLTRLHRFRRIRPFWLVVDFMGLSTFDYYFILSPFVYNVAKCKRKINFTGLIEINDYLFEVLLKIDY